MPCAENISIYNFVTDLLLKYKLLIFLLQMTYYCWYIDREH